MAWLNPYVIKGVPHTAELFRLQAQRPATDQVGVSRPGDLKVTQLPAAATGFRIAIGGLSLRSRFPGHERESYGVQNSSAVIDIDDVEGTGSTARRDAIVVELLDPNYMEITHEEAALTNYMRVHVVQGVAAGAKTIEDLAPFNNRTAYVLAFIPWPANTTAITNAMIQDARKTANPRSDVLRLEYRLPSGDSVTLTNDSAYPAGATWPSLVEAAWGAIDIPEDATRAIVTATWSSVFFPPGSAYGGVWLQIGASANPARVVSPFTAWDSPNSTGNSRFPVIASGTVSIPDALRGTAQVFYPRANVNAASASGARPSLNSNGTVILDVVFVSEAR